MKNDVFTCLLIDILDCAEKERNAILVGKDSLWNLEQIQKVIVPEISELQRQNMMKDIFLVI